MEKRCGQSSDRGRIRQRLGILDATFEGEICHSGFRCLRVDSTSRPNIRCHRTDDDYPAARAGAREGCVASKARSRQNLAVSAARAAIVTARRGSNEGRLAPRSGASLRCGRKDAMQQLIPPERSRLIALSAIGQSATASLTGARVLVVEATSSFEPTWKRIALRLIRLSGDFFGSHAHIISAGRSMCVNGSSCEDGTVPCWAAWRQPWRRFHARCACGR